MRVATLVALPVAALAATATMIPLTAQPAAAATSSTARTRCSVFSYIGSHHLASVHSAALVTHSTQVVIAPHGTHSQSRTATSVASVMSKTSTPGSASGSANWLWASVSVHVQRSVAKAGKHTSTKSVKITDTVTNRSGHNRAYVVYKGVTRYSGRYCTTNCKSTTSSRIGTVTRRYGSYVTWSGAGEGIAWRGGGAPTALVMAALKGHCR